MGLMSILMNEVLIYVVKGCLIRNMGKFQKNKGKKNNDFNQRHIQIKGHGDII